ncbi:hypothetical protein HJG60_008550 [Phyllostomus discolor]|uniref:Uncharacterized protein n=1 Tax=Phyllostomus discolor TaxID=89673 RepID=A0A833Z4W3_9CHIR|nr:hypothetical protein HJG60_008550 [Phyllostomus discolor]
MLTHKHQKNVCMVHMTFIGQSAPDIRRKLHRLEGALAIHPFQLEGPACKVYRAWGARKLKQAAVFLEGVWGDQKERQGPKGEGRDPVGTTPCACCKGEGQWREDRLGLKKKNKKDRNTHWKVLGGNIL